MAFTGKGAIYGKSPDEVWLYFAFRLGLTLDDGFCGCRSQLYEFGCGSEGFLGYALDLI
jgi:hypothetical protein